MQRGGRTAGGPELIVIGLGNPGSRYAATRHNAGWWLLDLLEMRHSASGSYTRHQSSVRQCEFGGRRVLLVRPQTFMNVSGDAVAAWCREFPATPWLLAYDDTSIPPGELRLKRNGSDGGHNGVKSVIERLRTQQFDRIKLGIGPPPHPGGLPDYVLGEPGPKDRELINQAITRAADAIELLARLGFDKAAQFATGGDAKQAERRLAKAERDAASKEGLEQAATTPPARDPNS